MLDNGLYICNISLVIATIENPTRFLCSKQEKGNLKYLHKKIGHYEKHNQIIIRKDLLKKPTYYIQTLPPTKPLIDIYTMYRF